MGYAADMFRWRTKFCHYDTLGSLWDHGSLGRPAVTYASLENPSMVPHSFRVDVSALPIPVDRSYSHPCFYLPTRFCQR